MCSTSLSIFAIGRPAKCSQVAQRPRHDLVRERTVALVRKMTTALLERRRQVGTFLGNRAERVIRRGTRGRCHGLVKRAPGCNR
jgi:hypothetical protein